MKYIFNIVSILLLTGCSVLSTERTPEEIAEYKAQVQIVHESALVPVYMLAREVCKYHTKQGTWPESNDTFTAGSFDHLEIVSSNKESIKFNLAVSSVNGTADFTINKLSTAPKETPYGFELLARFPDGNLNTKNFFSCEGKDINENDLMGYSATLTSTLRLYNVLAKVSSPKQTSLTDQSIEVGVKATLCILLKLEPHQCSYQ